MKILITTPSGIIGRRIVRELLAPEFSVRVITNDPALLPAEMRGEVEVVVGSSDDVDTLRRALEGVEAMFWNVPDASFQTVEARRRFERFARAAARAAREAGTRRVVTISAGGMDLENGEAPGPGLKAMDDILDESGAAIRRLRCGVFMEHLLRQARSIGRQGFFTFPMAGDVPIPLVVVEDIADVALRWLVRRDWDGVADVTVHGPEDISLNQAAAVLQQVLDRPVRYHEASANRFVQSLITQGVGELYARSLIEMFAGFDQRNACPGPGTRRLSTPTTLATWAGKELLPRIVEWLPAQREQEAVAGCALNCGE